MNGMKTDPALDLDYDQFVRGRSLGVTNLVRIHPRTRRPHSRRLSLMHGRVFRERTFTDTGSVVPSMFQSAELCFLPTLVRWTYLVNLGATVLHQVAGRCSWQGSGDHCVLGRPRIYRAQYRVSELQNAPSF